MKKRSSVLRVLLLLISSASALQFILLPVLCVALSVMALIALGSMFAVERDWFKDLGGTSGYTGSWGSFSIGDFVLGDATLAKLPVNIRQHGELVSLVYEAVQARNPSLSPTQVELFSCLLVGICAVESNADLGSASLRSNFILPSSASVLAQNSSNCVGPFQILYSSREHWLNTWDKYATPPIPSWQITNGKSGAWTVSNVFLRPSPFFAPDWAYGMARFTPAVSAGTGQILKYAKEAGATEDELFELGVLFALTSEYHGEGKDSALKQSIALWGLDILRQYGTFTRFEATSFDVHGSRGNIAPFRGSLPSSKSPLLLDGKVFTGSLMAAVEKGSVFGASWKERFNLYADGKGVNIGLNYMYGILAYLGGKFKVKEIQQLARGFTETESAPVVDDTLIEGDKVGDYYLPLSLSSTVSVLTDYSDSGSAVSYGVELGVPASVPVLSCTEGKVYWVVDGHLEYKGGTDGNYVVVQSLIGGKVCFLTYTHLTNGTITVKTGDIIPAGFKLGMVGLSGAVTDLRLGFRLQEHTTDGSKRFINPNSFFGRSLGDIYAI